MSTPAHTCSNISPQLDSGVSSEDDLAGASLHSDVFAILNQRPLVVAGAGRPIVPSHKRQTAESHTRHPRAPEPYDGPSHPPIKVGKADGMTRRDLSCVHAMTHLGPATRLRLHPWIRSERAVSAQ